MDQLIELLKVALADTVAFKHKAQQYHWNVEGPDFPMYHAFLGDIYEEVDGAIDTLGELIRTLDAYAPYSLSRLSPLTTIGEGDIAPTAEVMMMTLYNDNNKVLSSLTKAYNEAERYSEFGVSNFIQDRIQAHKKHQWMLRSITKGSE